MICDCNQKIFFLSVLSPTGNRAIHLTFQTSLLISILNRTANKLIEPDEKNSKEVCIPETFDYVSSLANVPMQFISTSPQNSPFNSKKKTSVLMSLLRFAGAKLAWLKNELDLPSPEGVQLIAKN